MSCNGGKTDGETKKSNRKCFIQKKEKNVFVLNQKNLQFFRRFAS